MASYIFIPVFLIVIFLTLFVYLGQAIWIYQDGRKRGDEYVWLWIILALVSFPVGLLVYVILSRTGRRRCLNCGRTIDNSHKICPYCGMNSQELCKNCGYPVQSDWKFCPNCNNQLKLY
jgi:RNA polymerase subunit RPABC4/transcription elongation factor Spt4